MTAPREPKRDRDGLIRCRVCWCTERDACNPPCSWFEPDLCSGCALIAEALESWREMALRPSMAALLREARRRRIAEAGE
jgi:hypothetical protein